jgi:hypothetical protein
MARECLTTYALPCMDGGCPFDNTFIRGAFIPGCYPTHNPSLAHSLTHYGLCCQCNSRPVIEVNSIDWVNSSICGRILIFKGARITMTIKNWRLQETFNTNKPADFKSFAFSHFVHILPNLQVNLQVTQQHWWRSERKKEPLWSLIDLLQKGLI